MREYRISMLANSCCQTECSLAQIRQICSSGRSSSEVPPLITPIHMMDPSFQPSFDFPPADFIDFLNNQSPNDFPKPIQLPNYSPMKIK